MAAFENKASRRTLVEFYDIQYLENIISLLRGRYSGVVYFYFSRANEPTEEDRQALTEYVHNNFGFEPDFREIKENTVDCALKSFRTLVNNGGVYDFDLTGGSSVFIAAAGALAVNDGGKRVFLHEYDPASGKRIFSYPENVSTPEGRRVSLTVDHVLALRGIEILSQRDQIRYQLEQNNLRGEIYRLWDAIRGEFKNWNSINGLPVSSAYKRNHYSVQKKLTDDQAKNCKKLLINLSRRQIISDLPYPLPENNFFLTCRLNIPENAKHLYEKAGNILEMLTYAAAADSGCFTDYCTGISLDWDNSDRFGSNDPKNEIDVVLTRDHIPYFVSCKNTEVTNAFMYEIMIMAKHFGGKYAVPALVCSAECDSYLHVRAKEMGVVLIDDVAKLSAQEFTEKLSCALGGN